MTSRNRVTPFSMPRSPMNALRFSTMIPGDSASTTNALIPPRAVVPSGSVWEGTAARTTSSSATTPFVVQSLAPLIL